MSFTFIRSHFGVIFSGCCFLEKRWKTTPWNPRFPTKEVGGKCHVSWQRINESGETTPKYSLMEDWVSFQEWCNLYGCKSMWVRAFFCLLMVTCRVIYIQCIDGCIAGCSKYLARRTEMSQWTCHSCDGKVKMMYVWWCLILAIPTLRRCAYSNRKNDPDPAETPDSLINLHNPHSVPARVLIGMAQIGFLPKQNDTRVNIL